MKRTLSVLAVLVAAWSPAMASDRLTDRDLKALVTRVYDERDRFEDALDGKLKDQVLRGATGEIKVGKFLDDFQENVKKLEDRIKPDYAASQEAATVLRQATGIDRFMKNQPAGTNGSSEWNRVSTDLQALASAYGTEFPTPDAATVRRMGDKEVAGIADSVAQNADKLKKSLDSELKKNTTIDQPTRQSMVDAADQLKKDAEELSDKLKGGDPSSAQAERLMQHSAAMNSTLKAHQVPSSLAIFAGFAPRIEQVAGAYAMPKPAVR